MAFFEVRGRSSDSHNRLHKRWYENPYGAGDEGLS